MKIDQNFHKFLIFLALDKIPLGIIRFFSKKGIVTAPKIHMDTPKKGPFEQEMNHLPSIFKGYPP